MALKPLVPADLNPVGYDRRMEAGFTPQQQLAAINPITYTPAQVGDIANRVGTNAFAAGRGSQTPDLERGVASLQEMFEDKRDVYRGILGDPEEQRSAAQSQALFTIANFGLQLAGATGGRVGASLGEKLSQAAEASKLFPTISAISQQQRESQQKFDVAALGAAEAERTAALKTQAAEKAARAKAKTDAAAARLERSQELEDQESERAFELFKLGAKVESFNAADSGSGAQLRYETRQVLRPDKTGFNSVTRVARDSNGRPIITNLPEFDTREQTRADGSTVLLTRPKGTNQPFEMVKNINGSPMVFGFAPTELKQIPDVGGGTRVVAVNSATQQLVPGGMDYVVDPENTVQKVTHNGAEVLVSVNSRTGDVDTIFTANPEQKIVTVGGNVVAFDRDENGKYVVDGTTIYSSPESPELRSDGKGRLVYAYEPSDEYPEGRLIPLHDSGPDPDAKEYEYANWIDTERGQTSLFYRTDKSRDWIDTGTGLVVPPKRLAQLVQVNANTAYEAATNARAMKAARERYLQTVMGLYKDKFIDLGVKDAEMFVREQMEGTIKSDAALDFMTENMKEAIEIARDIGKGDITAGLYANIDLREQVEKGTGLANRLKSAVAAAGGAIFNANWWRGTVEARALTRQIMLDLRLTLANSPRVAEGEQSRLAEVLPDVKKWVTGGTIEADKLRAVKTAFQEELLAVRKRLASPGTMASPDSAFTRTLQQSEMRLENSLVVLNSIIPFGVERRVIPSVRDRIEDEKAKQSVTPGEDVSGPE
tara:strand:+ start:479 stop:2785 length:2307 start_codon:yes stop_codon:yes gene_type:complete